MGQTVMRTWIRRIARQAGISRRAAPPLLSESEFLTLKKMILHPDGSANSVDRFSREFAGYLGVRHGVAVNSGTTALEIAVAALEIGPGDEVIIPSYSYYSTTSAVLKARARPVFADVRLEDGCIDPEEVRRAVTSRTRAVIAVHLAGVPANLDDLLDICRARGLALIEDVAQGVGGEWRGRKLGSYGALGCFSFQASKNLAAGEGGFIAMSDSRTHAACSALANVGLVPGGDQSEHRLLGGNYRLPQLEAAILSILIAKIDEPIERREDNAAFLTESLQAVPGIITPQRPAAANRINYHFYGFRFDPGKFGGLSKRAFISTLNRAGIPCHGGYPRPAYAQPAFQRDLEGWSQPGSMSHPRAVALCDEAVGFDQLFLLGEREEMVRAVEAIQGLSTP